jgi:hypothetical protein
MLKQVVQIEPLGFKGLNASMEIGLEENVEKTEVYVDDSSTNAGLNRNTKTAIHTLKM